MPEHIKKGAWMRRYLALHNCALLRTVPAPAYVCNTPCLLLLCFIIHPLHCTLSHLQTLTNKTTNSYDA